MEHKAHAYFYMSKKWRDILLIQMAVKSCPNRSHLDTTLNDIHKSFGKRRKKRRGVR